MRMNKRPFTQGVNVGSSSCGDPIQHVGAQEEELYVGATSPLDYQHYLVFLTGCL